MAGASMLACEGAAAQPGRARCGSPRRIRIPSLPPDVVLKDQPLARVARRRAHRCGARRPGPGPRRARRRSGLRACLQADLPTVADADALTLLTPDMLDGRSAPLILTPHAGEMARLAEELRASRPGARSPQAKALAAGDGRRWSSPKGPTRSSPRPTDAWCWRLRRPAGSRLPAPATSWRASPASRLAAIARSVPRGLRGGLAARRSRAAGRAGVPRLGPRQERSRALTPPRCERTRNDRPRRRQGRWRHRVGAPCAARGAGRHGRRRRRAAAGPAPRHAAVPPFRDMRRVPAAASRRGGAGRLRPRPRGQCRRGARPGRRSASRRSTFRRRAAAAGRRCTRSMAAAGR